MKCSLSGIGTMVNTQSTMEYYLLFTRLKYYSSTSGKARVLVNVTLPLFKQQ